MEVITQNINKSIPNTTQVIPLITAEQWLTALLQRNELTTANGQPLYQYHVTESEYYQLRDILKRIGQPKVSRSSKYWCAAFCLYCSEWYRRSYLGGWNWHGIWHSLNLKVEASDRQYVIDKGLRSYWNRPVSQYNEERNSYLGSVLKEGGLPYGLLASEGSRFQAIFKRILKSYEDAKALGYSPQELVKECMAPLPEAFKQETTVNLINKMVELLLRLTDEHNLDERDNPAVYLDDNEQGWREIFPIPLDGNTGSDFLSGLLNSASQQQRSNKKADKRIDCQQWLANTSELQFISQIKLAKRVDMPFRREDLVNSRVELFIYEGNTVIEELGVGHINFESTKANVILRTTACKFNRKDPKQCLYLVVLQAGKILHREEISNSEINIEDLPIVLRCNGEHKVFIGAGSISTRSEFLTVLCPKNAKLNESEAKDVRITSKQDLTEVTFTGQLGISIDSEFDHDNYLVTTTASSALGDNFSIIGDTLSFHTSKGQPVYLGVPKISTQDVWSQLLIGGKPIGEGHRASIFGLQTVKAKSNKGHTIFHKRLAILPKSFAIKLVSSGMANKGSIELHCEGSYTASILTVDVDVNTVSTSYGKRLDLTANAGIPPREILLKITLNLLADPIVISVPFPSTGMLAYNRDNGVLAQKLTIDDLLGSRFIFFPRLGENTNFKIELSCINSSRQAYYLWVYRVQDQPLEISLYEFRHQVRELLAANGNLDDQVRLEVTGSCKSRKFQIGRYSALAQQENFCTKFESANSDFAQIKPVMMDLTNPAAHAIRLTQRQSQGVPIGVFELSNTPFNPSLIVPSPDSTLLFRAQFVPGNKAIENPYDVQSLQKAALVCHINKEAIDQVLDLMIRNPSHSGWQFLRDLESQFGYLPMATFEVWKALAKRQDVLAALAFMFDNPISLMTRLQVEFNVIWELIPLHQWQLAVQYYQQEMNTDGYPDRIISKLLAQKIDQLAEICPVFDEDCRHLICDRYSSNNANLRGVFQFFSTQLLQEITTLHTNDRRWPTMFSYELETWCSSCNSDLVSLTVPRGFQKSVLYFPFFAAALVSGDAKLSDAGIGYEPANEFFLRQLIEFDRQWFVPMYKLILCIMTSEKK